jgi:hypothetical protein
MTTPPSQSHLSVPGATVDFPERKAPPMPTTTTNPHPDVPLPAGAQPLTGEWYDDRSQLYRLITGDAREVTDAGVAVLTDAVQFVDGGVDQGEFSSPPSMIITREDTDTGVRLFSDQARELAAVLLEAAAELDRWADA